MKNDVTEELIAIVEYLSKPKYTPQTAAKIAFNLSIPLFEVQPILTYLQSKGCIKHKIINGYDLIERIRMYPMVIELIAKNVLKI